LPERCTYGDCLLKIDHVCLSYDDKVILRDVNAEVRDIVREGSTQGQVVGFLGPSGIGKTQLFRIIAGLNQPTSGQVLVNSTFTPVKAGMVGVVAQDYPLFENRTIFSNLMLAAKQREKTHEAAHEKVMTYLRRLDMLDRAQLYPAQISGGQRQRIAISQQLLCSDHFLLMDEPFSGLDVVISQGVRVDQRDRQPGRVEHNHRGHPRCDRGGLRLRPSVAHGPRPRRAGKHHPRRTHPGDLRSH